MQQTPDFLNSVIENFTVELFDKKMCMEWILHRLHPHGAHCPGCGKPITSSKSLQNFWSLHRTYCNHCKKIFTALTGTMLNGIQIGLQTLFAMAVFLELGADRNLIARMLKVHPETVRLWSGKFKIMEAATSKNDHYKGHA